MDELDEICEQCSDLTLLYAEDDDIVRMTTMCVLEEFFNDIIVVVDGEEALESYYENKNEIDIIITDISMPKLDGINLVKIIRKSDKDTPIIVFSAHNEKDFFNQIEDNYVNGYLFKPIDVDQLIEKLLHIIAKRWNDNKNSAVFKIILGEL